MEDGVGEVMKWVRDLEEFDGAILSEYEEDRVSYVEKWCDRPGPGLTRTLRVRSDRGAIQSYLEGGITLMNLLTRYQEAWLVDRNERDVVVRCEVVSVPTLSSYLPASCAKPVEGLRPT